jgi:uncharacterized protein (TIGR04255 family)
MAYPIHSAALDHGDEFPHLSRSPLVETVLEWRAEPIAQVSPENVKEFLAERFNGYSILRTHDVEATIAQGKEGLEVAEKSEHSGFRLASEDGRVVCLLRFNGVAVSRLAPYCGWSEFIMQARPFRDAFLEMFKSSHFSRLGVRSINRVTVPPNKSLRGILRGFSNPWDKIGLGASAFFHQDSLRTLDSDYGVRVVRAMDPAVDGEDRNFYVDIDVTYQGCVSPEESDERMAQMRSLKNRVFFHIVPNAVRRFG